MPLTVAGFEEEDKRKENKTRQAKITLDTRGSKIYLQVIFNNNIMIYNYYNNKII